MLTFFYKVRIISEIPIIAADEQKTDIRNQGFVELWNQMLIEIIIMNLITSLDKAAKYSLAVIGRKIGYPFFIGQHQILQTVIDSAASGHQMRPVSGIRTDVFQIVI